MKTIDMISGTETIQLAHGGGGRLSMQLVQEVFLPVLGNEILGRLNDSAVLDLPPGRTAFTTDSFVVDPVFFPGGDIGRLAVCGTVNDLAVMGAVPVFLSIAFILEEGFAIAELIRIITSIKEAADEAEVTIVTGDTKVVPKGSGDKIFITTSGLGVIGPGTAAAGGRAHAGDAIIISGSAGRHGMAVMTSRKEMGFTSRVASDAAPLNHLTAAMLAASPAIHVMRDATRGGVATVLNEIASQASLEIRIREADIPVNSDVKGACELLGFDPLYTANEGVLVAAVDAGDAERVVEAMRTVRYGEEAAVIGLAGQSGPAKLILETCIGSSRVLSMLSGEQLPRIC